LAVMSRPGAGIGRVAGPILLATLAFGMTSPASAQTGGGPLASPDATVQSLRQEADAASGAYFAALAKSQTLQAQIDSLEAQLPKLRAEEQARLRTAAHRAVAAYEGSGAQLGVIIGSGDLLTAARRAHWLEQLNAQDNRELNNLRRAADRLATQERALRAAQQTQAATLQDLQTRGHDIDVKLQAAEARQRQLDAAAAAAAAAANPSSPAGGGAPAGGGPAYSPTPGSQPHHDDPFLVCVRSYESGGNYGAYNPSGPYMGAYQFLQSTWDSTANHAGRPALIGVRPNTASVYDQDDMAWDLYQWQGKGPWSGDPC
jgi:Transglycosylase-like domain